MKKRTYDELSHQTKSSRYLSARLSASLIFASILGASPLFALDGSWLGTTDGNWDEVTNWSSGTEPVGVHTATFDGAGNGNVAVMFPTVTQPILNIIFDTADAAAYTFLDDAVAIRRFRLRANGEIRMTDSVVNDQTFNCTVSLGVSDNPDTFYFLNDSTSAKLIFNGLIEGDTAGAATVGTKNLNIGGAGDIDVNGVIENTAQGLGSQRTVGLTKVGTGTLTLSNAANIYTGFTRVTEGTLALTATGTLGDSLEVNVSAGALLSLDATNGHLVKVNSSIGGTGTVSGGLVTVESGGSVSNSDGSIGTLTLESLQLDAGWLGEFELSTAGTSDIVDVTASNGLAINDGSISLFEEGTQNPFSTPGIYTLFQYAGTLGGAATPVLTVANPAPATTYSFSFAGGVVELTVSTDASFWDLASGGSWNTAANWTSATAPDGQNMVASFGGGGTAIGAASTVTVDGDKTLGKMIFDSVESFTLNPGTPGTSAIIFDADPTAPTLQGVSGSHTVAANLVIPATFELDSEVGSELTLSGAISGDGGIRVLEGGTVTLAGANTYFGDTEVQSGTLNIQGDQSGLIGGLSAGTVGGPVAILNIDSGATVNVGFSSGVAVGTPNADGTAGDTREIFVAGAVTNNGTLDVGRFGALFVGNGGSWTQAGNLKLQVIGNVGNPQLMVEDGGTFTYTGFDTIEVNGPTPTGAAQVGNSVITISGDFLTGAGFEETKIGTPNPGTGRGEVVLDGGTIQLTADVPDLVFADVGEIRLILESNGTIDTNGFDSTVSVGITGSGNLIKAGLGKLTLSGVNAYAGETIVEGGVLSVNGSSLPNLGILDISGGIVEITADETVADLSYDGGAFLPIGVYGSTSSAAPVANQDDTRFSGTGVLNVVGFVVDGYGPWATDNAGDQAAEGDFDLDGVQNGIEYFMNAAAGFTEAPGVVAGSVTWPNGGNIESSEYGFQFWFETSSNLVDWDEVLVGDAALDNQAGSVTYTLPTGVGPLFVRLVVDPS